MKKTILIITLSIFSIATLGGLSGLADGAEKGSKGSGGGGWFSSRPDIEAVQNTGYQNECAACHFAYQPGLLPQASWVRIMDNLENHFGDDASLDAQQTREIRDYLLANAADQSSKSRSRSFAKGPVAQDTLPRITTTRYFQRKHDEMPMRLVKDNPDVGSFSNCQACHQTAEQGIYDEDNVRIPGARGWSD